MFSRDKQTNVLSFCRSSWIRQNLKNACESVSI